MDSADKKLLVVHEAMMALSFLLASAGSMLNAPIYAALGIMLAGSVMLDGALREIRLTQLEKKRNQLQTVTSITPPTLQQPIAATVTQPEEFPEAPRTLLWD